MSRKFFLISMFVILCAGTVFIVWRQGEILHTSPGMDVIVYSARDSTGEQLYAVTVDGTQKVPLTYNLGLLAWWLPLPNPFGSVTINSNPMAQAHSDTIIFLSNSAPNGDYAFYQIALKSQEQHRLAFHSEANPNARLSPDRSRVALIDHDGHLVVMMNDGSQRLCITCSIQDRVGSFSWRPDNQQLLFEQWEADGTTLYRIDADGHNVRRLTPPNVSDRSPSWSPDGTQIAFVSDSDGPRIFVMQADGSQRKQITNHTNAPGSVSVDANPAWSPDGERLVYVSSRPSGNDIYVISKNGLNEQQLTKGERASNPTWMHVQE